MSKVRSIDSPEEFENVKNDNDRFVMFYGAKDCKACTNLKPLYDRIANRYSHKIALGYTDVDECKLSIAKIPLFVAYYKGEEIERILGADGERLKDFIRDTILHNTRYVPKEWDQGTVYPHDEFEEKQTHDRSSSKKKEKKNMMDIINRTEEHNHSKDEKDHKIHKYPKKFKDCNTEKQTNYKNPKLGKHNNHADTILAYMEKSQKRIPMQEIGCNRGCNRVNTDNFSTRMIIKDGEGRILADTTKSNYD